MGLREHKKQQTRQLISDTATGLFLERGFDAVRVAEVAEASGVSEKTVYNYFPTKESLALDRADDLAERLGAALADTSTAPVDAVVGMIERDARTRADLDHDARPTVLAFGRMVLETPALLAAVRAQQARLVDVAATALAARDGTDAADAGVQVAAHALVGLLDVRMRAIRRLLRADPVADDLDAAVLLEVRAAADVLRSGLGTWPPRRSARRRAERAGHTC